MILEISNNSSNIFKTCQRKYEWRYIQGLTPKARPSALTLGYAIHEAFDMFYKGKPMDAIAKFINDLYKQEIAKAPLEDQDRFKVDYKMALGMFLNYPYPSFPDIQSEVEFRIPLGYGVRFVGRVDGIVKHEGKWWVRELKTTGVSTKVFEQRAQVSSQATGYIYAMRKVTGLDIQGVMYDCLRKSALYRRKNEAVEEYAQRVYQDYGYCKKWDSYFKRYFTYRSPFELDLWRKDMDSTVKQIRARRSRGGWCRNTNACWVYNSECPYRRICFVENLDSMVVDLFYERKGA